MTEKRIQAVASMNAVVLLSALTVLKSKTFSTHIKDAFVLRSRAVSPRPSRKKGP